MAKIFVSYSRKDRSYVEQIVDQLKLNGHEIVVDVDSISAGQNWQQTLAEGLKISDVFIAFISSNSVTSQNVLIEIGAARAYASESDRMLVIPIVIDEVQVPPAIQSLLYIGALEFNVAEVVGKIEEAIARFVGRKAAEEEKKVALSQRMEKNAAEYINEAMILLERLEKRNRYIGFVWYVAGFLSLIAGIFFGVISVIGANSTNDRAWADLLFLGLKGLVVVGLLGACSKYAFTLGRSYVSESLKSADRIHAISFGRFFLRVYGENASWPEVKEVFQHWNIDRGTNLNSPSVTDFDPKFLEAVVEVAKAVSIRGPEKS